MGQAQEEGKLMVLWQPYGVLINKYYPNQKGKAKTKRTHISPS